MTYSYGRGRGRPLKLDDYWPPAFLLGSLVAFACAMGAMYFWQRHPDILGLQADLRTFRAGRDLSAGFLLTVILFGALWAAARPVSLGELGRVALVSLLQNIWFRGALDLADLTQARIAPDRYFLVTFAALALYAAPVAAAAWVFLRRPGIIPDPDGGVSAPAMALLALPGLLLAGMALDLLDASRLVPLLEGPASTPESFGRGLYVGPMAVAVFVTSLKARPETTRHWIVLTATITLAMQVATLLCGVAFMLDAALDLQGFWGTTAMALMGSGFVYLANVFPWFGRLLAGPDGPWPEHMD